MAFPLVVGGMAASIVAAMVLVYARVITLQRRSGLVLAGSARAPRLDGAEQLKRLPTPRERHNRRPTVSVVVPTLNEEGSLAWVLEQLPAWVDEVVLVDGLSIDRTEAIARDLRSDVVVVHQSRPGKGAALRAGFLAAKGDIIVMLDADGSTDPRELERFVLALEEGADFVKGSRHLKGGGSDDYTGIRQAGNFGFVQLVNLLYGSDFSDLCYGYCAFWRRHLDALALTATGFEIETELILNAVKASLRIREVPSHELPRRAGKSNLNAFRDGRRVLRTILDQRPGRQTRDRQLEQISLVPVELASPGSAGWVPAGSDHRARDRRVNSREQSGYTGPERRVSERRATATHMVTVYRAVVETGETVVRLAA